MISLLTIADLSRVRRCDTDDAAGEHVEEGTEIAPDAAAIAAAAAAAARTDADEGVRVQRQDRGALLRSSTTAEGFILCEGYVARPGVMTYRNPDGSVTREFIPPEELHRADSLATLGRKPVTLEHPPEDVTPDNVATYGVGDTDGEVTVEPESAGGFVRVRMAVRRVDAVQAMRSGIRELSPGYSCRIDATPGTHAIYGAYDAIQRDRKYNHTAITRAARGGHAIAARVDTAIQIDPPSGAPMNPKMIALLAALGITSTRKDDAGDDAAIDAAIAKANEMSAAIDAALPAATAADLRAKVAALETELASTKALLSAAEASVAPAVAAVEESTPAAVDLALEGDGLAPVADGAAPPVLTPEQRKADAIRAVVGKATVERARLEHAARGLRLAPTAYAHLGNASLRKLVVTTANPAARKDGSVEYYRAAADMLGATRTDSVGAEPNPYVTLTAPIVTEHHADPTQRQDTGEDAGAAFFSRLKDGFNARHTPGATAQ